jgi:hypothetical protein
LLQTEAQSVIYSYLDDWAAVGTDFVYIHGRVATIALGQAFAEHNVMNYVGSTGSKCSSSTLAFW